MEPDITGSRTGAGAGSGDQPPTAQRRDRAPALAAVHPQHTRAGAWFNRYLAALEQHDWTEALAALQQAAALDPERFEPFPLAIYEVQLLLGAGNAGATFLCRHRPSDTRVVVKALHRETLERGPEDIFREARLLQDLSHPAVLGVRTFGYAGAGQGRPYLVCEHFQGLSLADYVAEHGPLAAGEFLPVAQQLAEGLRAAHGKGVLHLNLRPTNVLVRRADAAWVVKLTDFGLAPPTLHLPVDSPGTLLFRLDRVAALLEYASPEQRGRLNGTKVGPAADVFGFGRLCYFALIGTPEPDDDEKTPLPAGWRRLLADCTARSVGRRLPDLAAVLDRLPAAAGPTGSAEGSITVFLPSSSLPPSATALALTVWPQDPPAGADSIRPVPTDREPQTRAEVLARLARARAHRAAGDHERAIAEYTEAIQLEPHYPEAYNKRGNVYLAAGDHDRAIDDYTEAVWLDPANAVAFMNRALAQAKKGAFGPAVADANEAIRLDPFLGKAYYTRGAAYVQLGDYDQAIADFTAVLRLDPCHALAYNDRGLAHVGRGEYDRAVADYEAALLLRPDLVLTLYNRALARQLGGDLEGALAGFTEVLERNPQHVRAYICRGALHSARGDQDRAAADFQAALELDPNNEWVREQLRQASSDHPV